MAPRAVEVGMPRGASFVADPESGRPMFRFVVDDSNVIGPRPATARDQAEYPGEWKAFEATRAKDDHPTGTDRDGDGFKGGGLPASPTTKVGYAGHAPTFEYTPATEVKPTTTAVTSKRRGRPPKRRA